MPRSEERVDVQGPDDKNVCIKCEQPRADCQCQRDADGKLVF